MDGIFRLFFVVAFLASILISGCYRSRARKLTGTIPRSAEGRLAILGRLLLGLPLLVSILLYALKPGWMNWASLDVPNTVRWVGALLALISIPLTVWVLRSIGANISETVLTKNGHELVTSGPYRWVRHPLYSNGLLLILAMALIAGSWFMLTLWVLSIVAFSCFVIPSEEANLIKKFGEEYKKYRESTGALLPRLG